MRWLTEFFVGFGCFWLGLLIGALLTDYGDWEPFIAPAAIIVSVAVAVYGVLTNIRMNREKNVELLTLLYLLIICWSGWRERMRI